MKTKLVLSAIVSMILLSSIYVHAQQKIEIIKKDDYFNDRGKKKTESKKNLIKIDPIWLPLMEAEASVFYERSLSEHISVELGVGINFSYWWYDLLHNYDFATDITTASTGSTSTSSNGIGMSLRGQVRYYFDGSDYPKGWYVAGGIVHKTFPVNYNITYFPGSGSFSEVTQAFSNTNTYDNYLLFIGKQVETSQDNLFFDFQVGVGIANYNKGLITSTDNNGYVGNINFTNNSYSGFAYSVNFKLGYAF